jgi:hypothetical protein
MQSFYRSPCAREPVGDTSLEDVECKVGDIDFLDYQIYAELCRRRHSSNSEVMYTTELNRFSYNPYSTEDSRVLLRNLTFQNSRSPAVVLVTSQRVTRELCNCILWKAIENSETTPGQAGSATDLVQQAAVVVGVI